MSDSTTHPTVREAISCEKLKNGNFKCSLCERQCEISQSAKGFCRTRINIDSEDAEKPIDLRIVSGLLESFVLNVDFCFF